MAAHGLNRGKSHDGKGKNHKGSACKSSSDTPSPEIAYSKVECGNKCLETADLLLTHLCCLSLNQNHLLLESQKDDKGYKHGQADDKKGNNDYNGAVGQLESRMHLVNDGNL